MKDWQKKRQRNLAELSLVAHILSYMITIIILIVIANLKDYTYYTTTIIFVGTLLPAAAFILLDYQYFQRKYERPALKWWNISKHVVLFIVITVVLANSPREHLWLFGSIYLLPVALSCITSGKQWGTAFAGAAAISIFLISGGIDLSGNQGSRTLEATLVLGSIFFLLAWFLGVIL